MKLKASPDEPKILQRGLKGALLASLFVVAANCLETKNQVESILEGMCQMNSTVVPERCRGERADHLRNADVLLADAQVRDQIKRWYAIFCKDREPGLDECQTGFEDLVLDTYTRVDSGMRRFCSDEIKVWPPEAEESKRGIFLGEAFFGDPESGIHPHYVLYKPLFDRVPADGNYCEIANIDVHERLHLAKRIGHAVAGRTDDFIYLFGQVTGAVCDDHFYGGTGDPGDDFMAIERFKARYPEKYSPKVADFDLGLRH